VRALDIATTPAIIDLDIAALGPTKPLQDFPEGRDARLSIGITLGGIHQYTDTTHAIGLLGTRHEWPRCRSTEPNDELSPFHSIT
jgi:hypothetical protein